MSSVALIIIYNHQYNKNIDVLEKIYEGRFSDIYHLVPFYTGQKKNVIPVYDSSYYFQGYVAQGLKSYFKEHYAHYFFVGDDLILNPVINENNYGEHLSLDAAKSFIPRLSAIDEKQGYWANNITALMYNRHAPGVEANGQLPGYDEAALKLQRLGIENMPLNFSQIWQLPITTGGWIKKGLQSPSFILRYLKSIIKAKKYRIAYPLVRSYSDIFVVSAGCIQNFCHYCGVFSATRLFVELAIPTALAFSAEDIATEKNIPLKGRALWTPEDFAILDKYENNLNKLTEHFPEGYLYLHPVKLSKWVFKI